jgi:hypothetical protein
MVRKNSFTITTLIFLFAKKLNLPDKSIVRRAHKNNCERENDFFCENGICMAE